MGAFESWNEGFSQPEQFEPDIEALECACLEPRLMEVPDAGEVLVGGEPFEIAPKLDDCQGDNLFNFHGDCGLVSVRNILAMADIPASEDEVVGRAIARGLCDYSILNDAADNGGTNVMQRKALLETYGISSTVFDSKSPEGSLEALAQYVEAGHGVNIAVNAGYAWDNPSFVGDGSSNHSIIVTGAAWEPDTGKLKGLFVCDSGLTSEASAAKFLSADVLKDAYLDAPYCTALVTTTAIRC